MSPFHGLVRIRIESHLEDAFKILEDPPLDGKQHVLFQFLLIR